MGRQLRKGRVRRQLALFDGRIGNLFRPFAGTGGPAASVI